MLNKKKIRTMSKIAVMEKHHGEELQKAREYYRSDYVAVQLLKNACYLTVAYMIGLLLWGVANMDMLINTPQVNDWWRSLTVCRSRGYWPE